MCSGLVCEDYRCIPREYRLVPILPFWSTIKWSVRDMEIARYKQRGACSAVVELYTGDVVNVKAVEGETAINGIGTPSGFAGFLHIAM